MDCPAVSVVLPVKNGGATLGKALDSLYRQTFRDFEIVAVDDGSTDDTPDILEAHALREPRLAVVTVPPESSISKGETGGNGESGLVAALNAGLARSRGKYIARMDCDDWCHPDRLGLQKDYLDTHPDVGLVSCLVDFAPSEGDIGNAGDPGNLGCLGYRTYVDWVNTLTDPEAISLARFVESPIPHPSACFRKRLVEHHGGYRHGPFPEDYELWLRWLDAGERLAKLDRRLLTWTDSPGRLSRTDPRYAAEAFYELKAGYLARWLARHNPCHPEVVVVGAGRVSRLRAERLTRHGVAITAYVDIDPRKIGRTLSGRPVLSRGELPPPGGCFVLSYVGSRGARDEIAAFLANSGFRQGRDFLLAA